MPLDLSAAKSYLHALETAENFPTLFAYCQEHDEDHLLDEAMTEIQEWCPWLWPQLDRAVLRLVENAS